LNEQTIRFLADENCDFSIVRKLRAIGYDVLVVSEEFASATDLQVLRRAVDEKRILLTEDKDFGEWIFAHREEMYGVLLIRYPGNLRSRLGEEINVLVKEYGFDLVKNFTVLEPGRARIRKIE